MDFIMECIVEILLELLVGGSLEVSKSDKTPKWLKYVLLGLISLFFLSVIAMILFFGLLILKENGLVAILMFALALFLFIRGVLQLKKDYLAKQ